MHHNITEMKKISTHLFADVLGIDDKQNKSLTTTATFANSGKNAFAQCSGRVQIGTMRIIINFKNVGNFHFEYFVQNNRSPSGAIG
ncbi:hypothetical protein T02_15890 [Trichinella nativa]|uniref:Uncharacterized protein n=1 Tax=Trichinella nativa TaxID=6335 RepID=A0A0V1LLQ6_9BILA|nr:hypothetical protein T02_15890 [Trichinella nativa]